MDNKVQSYDRLSKQIKSFLSEEMPWYSHLSNFARLYYDAFAPLWVGFYIVKDNQLYIGPYQGPLACTQIEIGKGVCGTACLQSQTLVVPNVHEFEGHIACSTESNSEIVVPIFDANGKAVAVLDIDSVHYNHFDQIDQEFLERIVKEFTKFFA